MTERPNDVLALDAKTGRVFRQYHYTNSPDARVCCGSNNRGVAILGDAVFMGTLDARLIAFDRKTGAKAWSQTVTYDKEDPTHQTNPYCGSTPAAVYTVRSTGATSARPRRISRV